MKKNNLVAPVVKWVGGKRQIIEEIKNHIPHNISNLCYCEPFVGGGAVLFNLQPNKAIINDINTELINLYNIIKYNIDELINDLGTYINDESEFYRIRNLDRDKDDYNLLSPVKKASRLIYLNKTCYNGLFRVNRAGEFNAPFGFYKNPNIINEPVLRAVSEYLNAGQISIYNSDYSNILRDLKKSSFVYLDPPYDPVSDTSSFTGYDKGGFDKEQQERLKEECDKLNKKGIRFLLSNSSTDFIRDLYREYNVKTIQAKRILNSNAEKRGEVDEILVRNYE
jgi:DNA adenine methylase